MSSDKSQPQEAPLFARIDPRIHWAWPSPSTWQEAQEQEIRARGRRKAQFGRAAERMAERRRKEGGLVTVEDRIPDRFKGNDSWLRAKQSFDKWDQMRWEKDKEAEREQQIREQLERDISRREETGGDEA